MRVDSDVRRNRDYIALDFDIVGALPLLGLLNILLGFVFVGIGLIAILLRKRQLKIDAAETPPLLSRPLPLALLLLANFPVAACCGYIAMAVPPRHTTVISNASAHPLTSAEIVTPDGHIAVGTVNPGQTVDISYRVDGEGYISLQFVKDGEPKKEAIVSSYCTRNLGGDRHSIRILTDHYQVDDTARQELSTTFYGRQ